MDLISVLNNQTSAMFMGKLLITRACDQYELFSSTISRGYVISIWRQTRELSIVKPMKYASCALGSLNTISVADSGCIIVPVRITFSPNNTMPLLMDLNTLHIYAFLIRKSWIVWCYSIRRVGDIVISYSCLPPQSMPGSIKIIFVVSESYYCFNPKYSSLARIYHMNKLIQGS